MRQAYSSAKYITILVQADVDLVAQPITITLTSQKDGTVLGPFTAAWVATSTNSGGVYSRPARYLRTASSVPRATYSVAYNLTDTPETGPDPVSGNLTIY